MIRNDYDNSIKPNEVLQGVSLHKDQTFANDFYQNGSISKIVPRHNSQRNVHIKISPAKKGKKSFTIMSNRVNKRK